MSKHVCGQCANIKRISRKSKSGLCEKNSGRAIFLFTDTEQESCKHFTTEKETSENNIASNKQ